jgi:transcription termination/antitermination protein NusG
MSGTIHNWYALFVRSRHEFATSEQLKKKGIEVLLPTVTRMRRWSDRDKAVTFPLFPGYLFVRVRPSAETFMEVMKTHGSVSFVSHEPGRPTPADPREMEALQKLLSSCDQLDLYPCLSEGAPVLVKQGPLKGAKGILAKKEHDHLFLVNIEILGRSVGTKVSAEDLELV